MSSTNQSNETTITREVHLPLDMPLPGPIGAERPLTFLVTNTCYTGTVGRSMLQLFSAEVASDTMGRHYVRRSDDNGASWSPPELRYSPRAEGRGVRRHGESCLYRQQF